VWTLPGRGTMRSKKARYRSSESGAIEDLELQHATAVLANLAFHVASPVRPLYGHPTSVDKGFSSGRQKLTPGVFAFAAWWPRSDTVAWND
jgi:hypothetical protein